MKRNENEIYIRKKISKLGFLIRFYFWLTRAVAHFRSIYYPLIYFHFFMNFLFSIFVIRFGLDGSSRCPETVNDRAHVVYPWT